MRKTAFVSAFAVAGAALAGSQVEAAQTNVMPPAPFEDSHSQIISNVYGAGVTATRIDDDLDQVWSWDTFGGSFTATAIASFAKLSQVFGVIPGSSGGSFQTVFESTGKRYSVVGSGDAGGEGDFRFGRKTTVGSTKVLSSQNSENTPDQADKMVTYLLEGEGFEGPTYVLFWEDLRGIEADDDYQDLVVEIRGTGNGVLIPSPAAFGAGLAMVGGMLLRRRSA